MENSGMTDHIFSELVSAVYGNTVDEREIWDAISKSGSIPKDASLKEARTGQALNVVATIGGMNAMRMAVPEARKAYRAYKGIQTPPKPSTNASNKALSQTGRKFKAAKLYTKRAALNTPGVRSIAKNPKRAAVVATGAAIGLHSAELAGDAIAARSLHRSAQRAKLNQAKIKKSLDAIVEARRSGAIDTNQAMSLFDEAIEKGFVSSAIKGAYKGFRLTKNKIPKQLRNSIPVPSTQKQITRTALGTGAVVGAAGTAGYMNRKSKRAIPPNPTVAKSDNGMVWTGEISKIDGDKRQVFGWCSLTSINGEPVVDLQGDYVPLEEIEKAAYEYVIHSRKGGDMHARDGEGPKHTADLIESFLVTPEKLKQMGLANDALPHGWWIGMKVNDDEQWNLVKSGGRTGFSIHGKGSRIEKML